MATDKVKATEDKVAAAAKAAALEEFKQILVRNNGRVDVEVARALGEARRVPNFLKIIVGGLVRREGKDYVWREPFGVEGTAEKAAPSRTPPTITVVNPDNVDVRTGENTYSFKAPSKVIIIPMLLIFVGLALHLMGTLG